MSIHWLGEAGCHARDVVGGKAANLSVLASGFPVPSGFVLAPSDGWASEAMTGAGMPAAARTELAGAYAQLAERVGAEDPIVAVRSSAVDEDGAAASFAGQHESYLNIAGLAAVESAAVACWASGVSERALEYRRNQNLSAPDRPLPVLVQSLVVADVSAVVFTANPLTGSRDEIVVNVSWGLGESIVGGSVVADSYVLAKDDLAIVDRGVADKQRMTVAVGGGTAEVGVPWALRKSPAADDDQLVAMAALARELEQRFGKPQDIECCWSAGRLHLLQSRAITTLTEEVVHGG